MAAGLMALLAVLASPVAHAQGTPEPATPSNEGNAGKSLYRKDAPTSVVVSHRARTSISLYWSDSLTDEMGYILERRAIGGADWRRVSVVFNEKTKNVINGRASFRFIDSHLTPDSFYCYRLIAFDDKVYSASPERCTQTEPGPTIAEMRKLPSFLSTHNLKAFEDILGDSNACVLPEIADAIKSAQEFAAQSGTEVPVFNYDCVPSSWGLDDFGEFFNGLKDVLKDGVEIVKCSGLALSTLVACPFAGSSLLPCIDGADSGDETLANVETCTPGVDGQAVCTGEIKSVPEWLFSCATTGALTALCVKVAREFNNQCL